MKIYLAIALVAASLSACTSTPNSATGLTETTGLTEITGLTAVEDQRLNALYDQFSNEPAAGGLLFWSVEDRRLAFEHTDRIYPTRRIHASSNIYELGSTPADLSDLTYEVDGVRYDLADFVAMPGNIGLIVIQDDNILYEHYAEGNDQNSRWISFSVTKSITSMLIGAAIKDGYITNVDEPVTNYLPRLRGTGYENTTIRNVLNMASGVQWNEDYADRDSDVAKAGAANSLTLVQYLGSLPAEVTPGEKFNYNTGETNLVGEILRAAIGNNATTYLERKIWQPFGMGADATWVLGEAHGAELGGCCISATLRDYGRIGIFALNNGRLPDGTEVLPNNWMKASTEPSEGFKGYGYLWWLFGDGRYAAQGIFGQLIFVNPTNNTVIAMHSNAETAVGSEYDKHQNAVTLAISDFLSR